MRNQSYEVPQNKKGEVNCDMYLSAMRRRQQRTRCEEYERMLRYANAINSVLTALVIAFATVLLMMILYVM